MKQETLSDMEYSCRKKKTKREKFLEIMDEIIPWDEWVGIIRPHYPKGERGRPPIDLELILRMYLLQCWFNLSDPRAEDAIYDSYAMRKFTGIEFLSDRVPDGTTLCKFRHLLEEHGLNKLFFDAINRVGLEKGLCRSNSEEQNNFYGKERMICQKSKDTYSASQCYIVPA